MTPTAETHFIGHKFRTLNEYFWEGLENATIHFSAPGYLNDPFDCQIDVMKAVRLAKAGAPPLESPIMDRWQAFAKSVTERAKTSGVFSLCAGKITSLEQRLLWPHYADDHKGVCVTYQVPDTFTETLVGFAPVNYCVEGLLNALRDVDLSTEPDFETRIKPVITAYLTTKAEQWKHEREARYISMAPGNVTIERGWLRQICFGLRTPADMRARVIETVRRCGYANCGFAELFHSEAGLYELELRDVAD